MASQRVVISELFCCNLRYSIFESIHNRNAYLNRQKMNLSRNNFDDFNSILDALQECDVIKYAAYRTAAKLRLLQGALFLDKLPLRIISNIFDRHNLHQTENSVQLEEKELESVLHDIYFVVKKEYYNDLDISHAVELMTRYLFNVFDRKKTNSVQVLCSKIGLTILCAAKPREKYQYLFHQLADHNCCLSKKKLEILLNKILHVTAYVNEEMYFRTELIPGTVDSCFQNNSGTLGVSEEDFISWLVQDPQILVWISTLYRMQLSELVCHNAKCAVCKVYPVVGLRYRCLRCLCYNQCQFCFFTGKVNKKHKLNHPVQEYCFQVTSRQSTKAFLLTLKNKLLKTNSKLQYLPAEKIKPNNSEILGDSTRQLIDEIEVSSRTVINGSRISFQNQPQKELHSIILHLERESEKIIPQIEKLCAKSSFGKNDYQSQLKKCLLNHKDQVAQQVNRLRLLKDYLIGDPNSKVLFESTPVVDNTNGNIRLGGIKELDGISPITRKRHDNKNKNMLLKKMMWDKYDIVNGTKNTSWEELRSSQFESDITELPDNINHVATTKGNAAEGNDVDLSTWLGGSALKELDYSSNRGFTRWLEPDKEGTFVKETFQNNGSKDAEGLKLQNEKYLQDIECDLEDILNKLQKLTSSSSDCSSSSSEKENSTKIEKTEEDVMTDIDSLLVGLINGIDKLIIN